MAKKEKKKKNKAPAKKIVKKAAKPAAQKAPTKKVTTGMKNKVKAKTPVKKVSAVKKVLPKAKPVAKSVAKPLAKPLAKTVAKPVAKSALKPVAKAVAKPIVKTVLKPTVAAKLAPSKTGKGIPAKAGASKVTVSPSPIKKVLKKISIPAADMKLLKERLMSRRAEIIQRLAESQHMSVQELEQQYADILDQSTSTLDNDLSMRQAEQDALDLMQIEKAVLQLESGHYGACEHCGEFIGVPRLKAVPFATLCIKCKSLQEEEDFTAQQLAARQTVATFTEAEEPELETEGEEGAEEQPPVTEEEVEVIGGEDKEETPLPDDEDEVLAEEEEEV